MPFISIHALRVEGDLSGDSAQCVIGEISIHALRVEGDARKPTDKQLFKIFLSTPSGWRATIDVYLRLCHFFAFLSTPSGWRATTEA